MSTSQLREAAGGGRAVSPAKQFSDFMDKVKPQLALALPAHLSSDRMARLALSAFSGSPALQRCSHTSIAASIMTAAALGLEPGVNGAGYLIPYGQTCTFVPGWKGLVDLVSRSGRGTVFTGVIFRDQKYTFTDGAKRDLVIHNESELFDPTDITHAYAIGWVRDSQMPVIELWSVAKIIKHRDKYNKVGSKHYSYRDWEMYCRKVPLLQVLKYMPSSIEMANAVAVASAGETGMGATIVDGIVLENDESMNDRAYPIDKGPAEKVDKQTGEITEADKPDPAAEKQARAQKAAEDKARADALAAAATDDTDAGDDLPDMQ